MHLGNLIILIMMFGLTVFAILAIGLVIILIIRACRGGSGNGQMTDEEERMLSEMSQGLETMERRMENLETILKDRKSVV